MVEDASRLVSGVLTLESLVCLRVGEWARDDARGELRPLEKEHIKVAGLAGRRTPGAAVITATELAAPSMRSALPSVRLFFA